MKSNIFVLLLATNASIIFGASIRGIAMENNHGRNIDTREAGANEEDTPTESTKENSYDCDEGCDENTNSPVCGVDGITYLNECLAVCKGVDIECSGACPLESSVEVDSFAREIKALNKEMQSENQHYFLDFLKDSLMSTAMIFGTVTVIAVAAAIATAIQEINFHLDLFD